MKITICGSLKFFKEMEKIRDELTIQKHEAHLPVLVGNTNYDNKPLAQGVQNIKNHDLIRKHYKNIEDSDAVLIINFDKNGIKNYVGGNSFLEMGFAHVLKKKIFVLNDLPDDLNYSEEMMGMSPVVINGDLNLIK